MRQAHHALIEGRYVAVPVAVPFGSREPAETMRQRAIRAKGIGPGVLSFRQVSPHVVEVSLRHAHAQVVDALRDGAVFVARHPGCTVAVKADTKATVATVSALLGPLANSVAVVQLRAGHFGLQKAA